MKHACPKCGSPGPFYESKGRRSSWCRECQKEANRARYQRDPDVRERANAKARERWTRPEVREKNRRAAAAYRARPEAKARKQERARALYQTSSEVRDRHRFVVIKSKYGLTREAFEALMVEQGGRCAICERPFSGDRSARVDHDHATGAVRGLLCIQCNCALGNLHDDPRLVHRALAYLTRLRLVANREKSDA